MKHAATKPRRRAAKPARKVTKKKGPNAGSPGRGLDAVAIAVGRALMRKPRVNPALLEAFKANRDLLSL
jgi:hypothetical protein